MIYAMFIKIDRYHERERDSQTDIYFFLYKYIDIKTDS